MTSMEDRYDPELTPPWGTPGCPILARDLLAKIAGTQTPEEISAMFNHLAETGETTDETRAMLRKLLAPAKFHKGWQVVPAGIQLEWVERLPMSPRTRNGIQRNFRGTVQRPWPEEGLTLKEFTSMRNMGIMSANELACLVESTEKEPH